MEAFRRETFLNFVDDWILTPWIFLKKQLKNGQDGNA